MSLLLAFFSLLLKVCAYLTGITKIAFNLLRRETKSNRQCIKKDIACRKRKKEKKKKKKYFQNSASSIFYYLL